MKKLITLVLVLTGMVTSAMATNITIYFKPNSSWASADAQFKLALSNSNSADYTKCTQVDMVQFGTSGIYYSTFDPSSYGYIKFLRMNPSGGVWNAHDTWTAASSTKYYRINYFYDDDWNKLALEEINNTQYTDWVISGSRQITPEFYDWGTESTTKLTSTDNMNYTLAISNRPVKAGTYKFKVVNVANAVWAGDASGNDVELEIENDGQYTITYTYNQVIRVAYATVTNYVENNNLVYKYFVNDENKSITGANWQDNEMSVSTGVASFTANERNLTPDTYNYNIVEQLYNGSTPVYKYDYSQKSYEPTLTRCYDVNFSFTISDGTTTCSGTPVTGGYYFIKSGTNWTVGERLTEKETGVWEGTISNWAGKYFALIPTANLPSGDIISGDTWNNVIRPAEKIGDYNCDLYFVNHTDKSTSTSSGITWYVNMGDDAVINVTYKTSGTWSTAPYFTRTINASAGYATFSSAYNVAIPGKVTAYYCTGVAGGELSMSKFTEGIPAGEGALLEGSGDVTFTPAASTDDLGTGTNRLKPGTGTLVPQTDGSGNTNFILTNKTVISDSADLKFYKVNSEGNTVPVGKAYLQIPSGSVGAHEYFWFEDETTGIEAAKASQKMNGEFFNLAGQRVAQPTKGLYIVNGKKVIMK